MTDHAIELMLTNAPNYIGMVILAYLLLKALDKLNGHDDD